MLFGKDHIKLPCGLVVRQFMISLVHQMLKSTCLGNPQHSEAGIFFLVKNGKKFSVLTVGLWRLYLQVQEFQCHRRRSNWCWGLIEDNIFPVSGEVYFKLALFWSKGQNSHSSWRTVNVFLNPMVQFDLIGKESG